MADGFFFPDEPFSPIKSGAISPPSPVEVQAALDAAAPPTPPLTPTENDEKWALEVMREAELYGLGENHISTAKSVLLARLPESGNAHYAMGTYYLFGLFGHPPNYQTARRHFKAAIQKGCNRAWYRMASCAEARGEIALARSRYETGSSKGDNACVYRLGIAHLSGQLGCRKDHNKGIELLEKASLNVDPDFPQPAYLVGKLHLGETDHLIGDMDKTAFQKDPAKGISLVEQAALVHFAPAMLRMAQAHQPAVNPMDNAKCVRYLHLAARQERFLEFRGQKACLGGEPEALLVKWLLCGCPLVVDQSEEWAYKLALAASKLGNSMAQFAVGYCYEVGLYIKADFDKALEYYSLSSKHGNTAASTRLESLLKPQRKPSLSRRLTKVDHQRAVSRLNSRPKRDLAATSVLKNMIEDEDEDAVEARETGALRMEPKETGAFRMEPKETGAFRMEPKETGAFQMEPKETNAAFRESLAEPAQVDQDDRPVQVDQDDRSAQVDSQADRSVHEDGQADRSAQGDSQVDRSAQGDSQVDRSAQGDGQVVRSAQGDGQVDTLKSGQADMQVGSMADVQVDSLRSTPSQFDTLRSTHTQFDTPRSTPSQENLSIQPEKHRLSLGRLSPLFRPFAKRDKSPCLSIKVPYPGSNPGSPEKEVDKHPYSDKQETPYPQKETKDSAPYPTKEAPYPSKVDTETKPAYAEKQAPYPESKESYLTRSESPYMADTPYPKDPKESAPYPNKVERKDSPTPYPQKVERKAVNSSTSQPRQLSQPIQISLTAPYPEEKAAPYPGGSPVKQFESKDYHDLGLRPVDSELRAAHHTMERRRPSPLDRGYLDARAPYPFYADGPAPQPEDKVEPRLNRESGTLRRQARVTSNPVGSPPRRVSSPTGSPPRRGHLRSQTVAHAMQDMSLEPNPGYQRSPASSRSNSPLWRPATEHPSLLENPDTLEPLSGSSSPMSGRFDSPSPSPGLDGRWSPTHSKHKSMAVPRVPSPVHARSRIVSTPGGGNFAARERPESSVRLPGVAYTFEEMGIKTVAEDNGGKCVVQ